ncbi:MAG: flagellar protein FlgN [Burkholderiaceae bacterium]|nr:flagellar protein FlgN [Burkholderiaceae bacterium]
MDGRQALTALLALLRDEHEALRANDVERLAHIAERKDDLLRRLAETREALPAQLVREARALNERNGALLSARAAFTQARLSILRGGTPVLYGRDGQVTS